jgi:chromosomal replication initiator protein
MYLGKLFTARSYPDIARRLGSRDHTTILYGAKKIARLREIDTGLEMDLRMIAASLGASLDR